jgi:hypothetical protein
MTFAQGFGPCAPFTSHGRKCEIFASKQKPVQTPKDKRGKGRKHNVEDDREDIRGDQNPEKIHGIPHGISPWDTLCFAKLWIVSIFDGISHVVQKH